MTASVYVASVEGHTLKSTVALGILETLTKNYASVGVFRPVTVSDNGRDSVLELLFANATAKVSYQDSIGVGYQQLYASEQKALEIILQRYQKLASKCDAVLVVGSDYTDVISPTELSFNARVATNIASPMVLVINGRASFSSDEHLGQAKPRTNAEIAKVLDVALSEITAEHTTLLGVMVNRADQDQLDDITDLVQNRISPATAWAIAEDPYLVAPRMSQIKDAVSGTMIFGAESRLQAEALDVVVAAMSEVNVLERLKEAAVVVAPGDRTDVILPLLMADASETFPNLAGIVLNGGFELAEPIQRLIQGVNPTVPVISCEAGSFDATMQVIQTRGILGASDPDKIARARRLFTAFVDGEKLLKLIENTKSEAITPLLFENQIVARASQNQKTIVLPEATDDRILIAAAEVLNRNIAKIILLGDRDLILARAQQLGLDLSAAAIISIADSEYLETAAAQYAALRSHKGVTLESAREVMLDGSYFGTMLVHLGVADGMVSGAVNTTAHTIKPSFEIIKTAPGVNSVSSVFLMALADRVLVYGDCAVIPEPTVEQLADIAISSANTARAFGIEPHVAMLSYSTGSSGSGAEVEKVRAATEMVRARSPQLSIEGPIQYDAAVDAAVAQAKLPQSSVAGNATVFIFPDLNTGNNTYKAVQRTAGAVAIGPVLQGLNKAINDLSRGALVRDIVNTIAITAIQAESLAQ